MTGGRGPGPGQGSGRRALDHHRLAPRPSPEMIRRPFGRFRGPAARTVRPSPEQRRTVIRSVTAPFALLSALAFLASAPTAAAQDELVNWETPHVSPLALTPDGTRLLAVNTPDDRLEVFDLTSG